MTTILNGMATAALVLLFLGALRAEIRGHRRDRTLRHLHRAVWPDVS